MLKRHSSLKLCIVFVALAIPTAVSQAAETVFTRDELCKYSKIQEKLHPDEGNLFAKLTAAYDRGSVKKMTFTADEITAVTQPKTSEPYDYKANRPTGRSTDVPVDAFSMQAVRERFAYLRKQNPSVGDLTKLLVERYGTQPWYTALEIKDVEGNKTGRTLNVRRSEETPIGKIVGDNKKRPKTFLQEVGWPRIRQSWRDTLYDEDPSQDANKDKALGDLHGASFAYTHNGKSDTDTWSAQGALIVPWSHQYKYNPKFPINELAIAPSVSVNRVDTNGKADDEIDQLAFRLGLLTEFSWFRKETPVEQAVEPHPSDGLIPGPRMMPVHLQFRAAGAYIMETGGDGALPGGEVDIEPRWQSPLFPVGYRKILLDKQALKEDQSDISRLDYQLRLWLHLEGGRVQDNAESWDATEEDFLRLGPTVQFQLNIPKLLLGKDASVSALYSYLVPILGTDRHKSYLKLGASYNLIDQDNPRRKISINADYQLGGLNYTKEDVDSFTLGLGILF